MSKMRISVVGTGHVGLTTAACFAHLGHEVLGVDDDAEKISLIERGEVPFHEPGLTELVREGLDTGRLRVHYVPLSLQLDGSDAPTCEQVQRVMETAHMYLRAMYPIEPSRLTSEP